MRPTFDDRDAVILQTSAAARAQLTGPLVGDWIIMRDGSTRRFTYAWPDGFQTTYATGHACGGDQSFYFGSDGHMHFSGGLAPTIPHAEIEDAGELREAPIWFFHHDLAGAHRGVFSRTPCRVYRQVQP